MAFLSARSSTGRRFLAEIFVLCIVLAFGQSALAQNVVINEFLQNPRLTADSDGEWIEIFNPTASGIDINGWTIEDNDNDSHVIINGGPLVNAPLIVPPGGFLVIGKNADPRNNGGVAVDYEFSGHFLSGGADELVLLDSGGAEVDRVEWDGGPNFPNINGASTSLIDPALDNNVGANWCAASTPFGDGDFGTPGAVNDCVPIVPPFGECGDPATLISAVQGDGPASPMVGSQGVELEGVVVGDFQAGNQLRGFFLQEEDADNDADSLTSEGIFVFDNGFGEDVSVGNLVRVKGDVSEFFGHTQLGNVINMADCGPGGRATPATVILPLEPMGDFEQWEGMLVNIPHTLHVSGNFNLGRFGEVDLSVGLPLDSPTNVALPGPNAITLACKLHQ